MESAGIIVASNLPQTVFTINDILVANMNIGAGFDNTKRIRNSSIELSHGPKRLWSCWLSAERNYMARQKPLIYKNAISTYIFGIGDSVPGKVDGGRV